MLVVLLSLVLSVASCSKDDDNSSSSSGSVSVKLKGETVKFSNVYWHSEGGEIFIEFYSYDLNSNSWPKSINYLGINYAVSGTPTGVSSVTLPSGDYHIYIAKNVTMDSEGWQGETLYQDTSNSPLIIQKNGNKYQISVEKATVGNDNTTAGLSINYNGTINKLPARYME